MDLRRDISDFRPAIRTGSPTPNRLNSEPDCILQAVQKDPGRCFYSRGWVRAQVSFATKSVAIEAL